jgi:hypothetical protein
MSRPSEIPSQQHLDRTRGRLAESARLLEEVARRMVHARQLQEKNTARIREINRQLRASLRQVPARRFSYLEFLEFSSADEFRRFRYQPPISRAEIEAVDMEELVERLETV